MKDWLTEIIDQIALGEFIARSKVSCGQRFGLIAVDNAVEFMLKAYVEVDKQLVGGHKVAVGGLTKKDWELKRDKFPVLLSYVVSLEPNLLSLEDEINRYHTFRNNLYHTGIPVTTRTTMVVKYAELARNVLQVLSKIALTSQEWDAIVAEVGSSLISDSAPSSIKLEVDYETVDGVVKLTTSASLTNRDAIALCLHGYSKLVGTPPSRPDLIKSLTRSGYSLMPKFLSARIVELRNNGLIQQNSLALSAKGRKELSKKYLL